MHRSRPPCRDPAEPRRPRPAARTPRRCQPPRCPRRQALAAPKTSSPDASSAHPGAREPPPRPRRAEPRPRNAVLPNDDAVLRYPATSRATPSSTSVMPCSASPPSPRPWPCCVPADVVLPLGLRRHHPGRATLDAVTTVTLLPRPHAVHHRPDPVLARVVPSVAGEPHKDSCYPLLSRSRLRPAFVPRFIHCAGKQSPCCALAEDVTPSRCLLHILASRSEPQSASSSLAADRRPSSCSARSSPEP